MKLTPLFMLAVIALSVLVPTTLGVSVETIGASALVVIMSTLFLEKGGSTRAYFARGQFGKVGEGVDVEEQYKQVSADLKKVGDDLKSYAEKTHAEIARTGEMNAETRAKVDELLMKQGELQARMQEAEQKLVNAGDGGGNPEPFQSAGQRVVESEEMEGVSSSFRGSRRIQMPRSAITSVAGSGAALVDPDRRPGIIMPGLRRMTIRDLVSPGATTSNAVEYVKELGYTNNAAMVSENPGAGKPYSDITFELANANVRTIAHMFKASRQILDDAPALQSYIDARGRYGLMLKEETQLLYGTGTGNDLNGLITQAEAYATPSGVSVTAAQRIDRIRLAMLQVTLAEYDADGIVLNPIDWAMIELTKDAEGRYIIGRPQDGTTPMLWNRPVIETQSIVQDEFLTGAFRMASQIYDRMEIEVLISTENDKDFEKNMVSIRAEERLAFAVYRPEAFVTGSLTAS